MRRSCAVLLFAPLLLTLLVQGQQTRQGVKLGPNEAAWKVAPDQGKLDAVAIGDGRRATAVGPSGLVLTTAAAVAQESELLVRFRITLPKGQGSGLTVVAGQKKPGDSAANALSLQLHVHPSPEPETVTWTLGPLPGEKQGLAGNYVARTLPANRLLLPEMTRRRVEQDYAAEPTLTRRWLTLRYELRKHAARVWLDGRLLREARHPGIDTTGFLRLTLWNGVQVAEVALRPLPPPDARFETVGLDHDLNADRFKGEAIPLPAAGKAIVVGGVPFALPAKDERGRTHIDLKPSWLPCGLAEGSWDPAHGDLARWRGATARDPGRIQFRVPNGQYARLHLLAAFTGEPDTTPVVTAQFYRPDAGHPVNFAGKVPAFTEPLNARRGLPARLAGGAKGHLHLVTIPLDPNGTAAFGDQPYLELELTKDVRIYRAFPDPTYYSMHAAGLPSGVHVFGVTLERPLVEVDFQPDQVAHIWTAPARPSYTARLTNTSQAAQTVQLQLTTTSHDGSEKTSVRKTVKLAAGAREAVRLPLALKRYGYHAVELKIGSAGEERTQTRSLAFLHPDTRERGNWAEGRGPIFGMWDWNGGHQTLSGLDRLRVLAAVGMESSMGSFAQLPAEEQKYLESIGARSFFLAYQLAMTKETLGGKEWDPKKPAEMQKALIKWLKAQPYTRPSKINEPELAVFFAEPLLGPISYMSLPEYYGDPPYQMTPDEKAAYKKYLDQFVIAAKAIKKEWPNAKCLMPWGIATFPIPFLRESKEATALMDGPAIDQVLFERMPEMQLHQVTFSSAMWQLRQEWLKTGKPWPRLITIEGPGTSPARPGAVTAQQEADNTVRAVLILASYNTTRFLGWPAASHCAGYWGEQHYGSGLCEPIPLLSPRPVYSAYATMTRQLNRMNFVKVVPTPSHTVFCLQFKHYKTGDVLHVLWTLRGKRPVSINVAKGTAVTVLDSMDNPVPSAGKEGKATFTLGTSPVYVRGLTGDAKVALGPPDHSDARPGPHAVPLADLGDGSWKLSPARDPEYEDNHPEFIKRFPGRFSVHPAAGPDGKGKALAVRLEKQPKERRTMPFYTTLVPPRPIIIPGKASHLGLWVRAASDWGRVVYCLKDAGGERWLSIGKKGEWNVDDTHNWSAFNYDGWRYLTFELPANAPYDLYREAGTSFWGNYPPQPGKGGKGKRQEGDSDMVVDLPLTLEKIIVERRTHVIHATEQLPVTADDVLLGGLLAEYETPADRTAETVRRSRLRMPLPARAPDLENPIRKLAEAGKTAGPEVTKVSAPEREHDGRRCHVHFAPSAGAKTYDVWVSTYADGRGAMLLGKDWTAPGQLLTGLSPNIDLYLFVVARDAAGKSSRPGKGFKVNLKDMFPQR
jgi:hypothetical protein